MRATLLVSSAVLSVACAGAQTRAATTTAARTDGAAVPTLVVVAIHEQLGRDMLTRLWPHLEPSGALH